MRSGPKRNYITIQKPTKVKSATGAVTITWSTFSQVWASIRTMRGNEKQSSDAAWPGSDSKIKIHYIEGLLPTMRISFNSTIYSILNINNMDERNRELELTCQSGVKAS